MGKLDKSKETLNNLRVALTLITAMIIATASGSMSALKENNTEYFFLGVCVTVALCVAGAVVFHLLFKKTNEIEDL